jgi:hypothetical protein
MFLSPLKEYLSGLPDSGFSIIFIICFFILFLNIESLIDLTWDLNFGAKVIFTIP